MRVILVDEQRVFRDTFRLALWHEAQIQVVGETDSARQLYSLIETEKPDLVVSELMLKDTDSISAARELRRRRIPVRIMLLTTYSNPLFLSDALDAGVVAYALKEQPLAEIVTAMQTAARGETYVSPQLAGDLPSADRRSARKPANGATGLGRLSHREREVFCRIIQGHSSQAIADSLCISVKTVETHRTHINRKLGVRSPVEFIRLAALQGLLAREATPQSLMPGGQTTRRRPHSNAGRRPRRPHAHQRGSQGASSVRRARPVLFLQTRGAILRPWASPETCRGMPLRQGPLRGRPRPERAGHRLQLFHVPARGHAAQLRPGQPLPAEVGRGRLTGYRFNTQSIHHLHCKVCGIKSFARGAMPDGTDGRDQHALPGRRARLEAERPALRRPQPLSGPGQPPKR